MAHSVIATAYGGPDVLSFTTSELPSGLALLGALSAALAVEELREPAVVTFAVAASGITALGISAAFWGLLAGLTLARLRPGHVRHFAPPPTPDGPRPPGRRLPACAEPPPGSP